jgi:formate hydrogenlyase subunit 6/NADH:ubiquinone oxidoreductase subunit I
LKQSKKKIAEGSLVKVRQALWVDTTELVLDLDPCISCELCRQVCPMEAISLTRKGERTVPWIDEEQCSLCGLCSAFCPARAITMFRRNSWKGTEEEMTPILDVGGIPHFSSGMALDASLCPQGCDKCVDACPRSALTSTGQGVALERDRCLSCSHCAEACPVPGAIRVTPLFDGDIRADAGKCPIGCDRCVDACPTRCFTRVPGRGVSVETRHCICCGACLVACFYGAIDLTRLRISTDTPGFSAVWTRAVDRLLSENARFLAQSEASLDRLSALLKESKL